MRATWLSLLVLACGASSQAGELQVVPSPRPSVLLPIALGSRVRVTDAGGRRQEGRLTALEDEALVLDAGGKTLRIPRGPVVNLELHEGGSSGLRVLGGLIGGVAGVAVAGLICASSEVCESAGPLWIGLAGGAAAGAALTGRGSWKPVTLTSAGPVALQLRRRGDGATAELRLGF